MVDPYPEEPEYLEDPEAKLEEWDEQVWGNDEEEARRNCLEISRKVKARLIGVERVSRRSKRWLCHFRSYE